MPSEQYILGRDYKAATRLNYQHWCLRNQLGSLLSPRIPADFLKKDGLRVADIGSGTGIWLTEVANAYPNAELHGFDVEAAPQPPQQWLPKNMQCHVHNAFEPFPDRFHGYFDAIHLRLFLVIIKQSDPMQVVQNLVRILKPGGYLQWVDGDPTSASIATATPDTPHAAATELLKFETKPRAGSNFSWVPRLSEFFEQAGLQSVSSDRYPIQPSQMHFWNMAHLMLYEEYSIRILNDPNSDESMREAARGHLGVVDDVYKEFLQGVSIRADFVCVVGRAGEA